MPAEDVEKLNAKATFNIDRIKEIELQTRHDIVAFTRTVSESLGDERKWVHYGLTSTDVVDTANGYLFKQADEILLKDLEEFIEMLKTGHPLQEASVHRPHSRHSCRHNFFRA